MISFKKYTDIIGDIAKKLKVSKDKAVNALIKAQEKGINPLKWQSNIAMLTTFASIVAEYEPVDEVFVIKYKTRVYYSKGEKRYWSVKDTDVSNPKDAMRFKSEKDAQDELDGMNRSQKGNYEIVKEEVEIDERQMSTPQKVAQMQYYWDDLSHMATDDQKKKKMEMKFGIKNIKLDPRKGKILSFEEDRDYKDEYKKFQSSEKMKKYRAELNRYNREKGTYGNRDGKDASHKKGKIVGFEDENVNRGRAEKSRLVGSKRN